MMLRYTIEAARRGSYRVAFTLAALLSSTIALSAEPAAQSGAMIAHPIRGSVFFQDQLSKVWFVEWMNLPRRIPQSEWQSLTVLQTLEQPDLKVVLLAGNTGDIDCAMDIRVYIFQQAGQIREWRDFSSCNAAQTSLTRPRSTILNVQVNGTTHTIDLEDDRTHWALPLR